MVSEIVTNAIRACGGLEVQDMSDGSAVRLWLVVADEGGVLVLVWDTSPSRPERQQPAPDAESGRGLVLVEALATSWGSFGLADRPGKVVWAHCQN